jgi:hypothetical protein
MRIYDGGGALTILGLRIGATSRSLGCGLCRGSVMWQRITTGMRQTYQMQFLP